MNAAVSGADVEGLVPEPRRRLRVVAGPQAGALLALRPGTVQSVGRAIGNDVVLRGEGVAGRHLMLSLTDERLLRVDAIGAGVEVHGEPVAPGTSREVVPDGASVSLGGVAFVVERAADVSAGAQSATAATAADGVVPGAAPADRAFASADADVGGATAAAAPASRRSIARRVGFALLATAACGALVAFTLVGREPAPVPVPLAERLVAAFPGLALAEGGAPADGAEANDTDGAGPVVTGYVGTREDGIRLERWIAAQPEKPRNRVQIESVLGERVLDVLRVNGAEASVVSIDDGAVTVATSIGDPERLSALRTTVERDVPAMVSLDFRDTPPPAAADDEALPPFDAGKRIALVVADEPPYLVTEDRSRYFLGALLPSGHRIASIDADRVMLEKGGVSTELRF